MYTLKKIKSKKKGWAMPLVLMLCAVVPILAVVVYNYTSVEIKQIEVYGNLQKGEYIAKSVLEAVIDSWQRSEIENKPSGAMETIYYTSNKEFVLESNLSATEKADSIGYVDVTVNKITDTNDDACGGTRFIAAATVDGTTKTISIVSSPYTLGHETSTPIVDYESGYFNYDLNTAYETSDFTLTKTKFENANPNASEETYTIHFFKPQGILELKTEAEGFYVGGEQFVGVTANMVIFHKPVNFYTADKPNAAQGVHTGNLGMIITADTIVFKERVNVAVTPKSHSTVIIQVPDGMGVPVDGHSGYYGRVYFMGGVMLEVLNKPGDVETKYIKPGAAYYVKRMADGELDFDLTQWMVNYREDTEYFFRITEDNNNRDDIILPVVDDNITFMLED